ncbi:hypothetical protein AUR64_19505 [Haloprofundus marisrubri]|uniref:Uncharacterized protein n=1 Tax=Haloprofundus marisrubri TaxID=1514971 RepID=A0A0W1R4Q4_9EURY|nr:hypothetical protein [Haloprofundus marisrubri]KTG08417.1 hypothetical protein AUR64_19505 [Haloprofundus marisrubri]
MPDGNRFAGLGSALGDEEADEQSTDDESDADTASVTDATTETVDDDVRDGDADEEVGDEETAGDSGTADDSPDEDEESGPAFSFEETTPKSVYVRDETLDSLEDLEFEVEAALRREFGVRDVTGREFHDALVRVAADHADDIAALVVETREE